MNYNNNIIKAKQAVIHFVDVFFSTDRQLTSSELQMLHADLEPFSIAEPYPNGRIVNGEPIDFVVPSFWHACCVILYRWIIERYACNEINPAVSVYRGQTNTWLIRPSLWRTTATYLEVEPLEVIRDFLSETNTSNSNPSIDFFPDFLSFKGIRAFAQHHEFPTSLIDFSFHPMVALFFACQYSNPQPITSEVKGMGVIYQSSFHNFQLLEKNSGIKPELIMLPPSHVFRIYQQRGFFIDCGNSPNENTTHEIERCCTKIFFSREYPKIEDVELVFSEERMLSYITHSSSTFKSSYQFEYEWYSAFNYYVAALEYLQSSYQKTPMELIRPELIDEIKKATESFDNPAQLYNTFGASSFSTDLLVAESISNAAQTIFDIAMFTGPNGRRLCQPIVILYAEANPSFFEALFIIAKRVTIFDIEEIARTFEEIPGLREFVAGSLPLKDRERLETITEMY